MVSSIRDSKTFGKREGVSTVGVGRCSNIDVDSMTMVGEFSNSNLFLSNTLLSSEQLILLFPTVFLKRLAKKN